jgi:hypothetical protein
MGFRELLATIVFAKWLDPTYSARSDLYSCNPRPLYERYLKPVFDERGIPSGQSGPLNIAKATPALNEQWASQRRGAGVAKALLRVSDWLASQPDDIVILFAGEVGARFDKLAHEAKSTRITLTPNTSSVTLSKACAKLIAQYPLSGAIPQTVCGLILETEFLASDLVFVEGTRDSASTTNRTAKKVGDLTISNSEGVLERVYEVTVKPFSTQRVREAVQSVRAYFEPGDIPENFVVLVLCRPEDIPDNVERTERSSILGELEIGGVIFEFIDIYEWISTKLVEFSINHRQYFFDEIVEYLNGVRIPAEVRSAWAKFLS